MSIGNINRLLGLSVLICSKRKYELYDGEMGRLSEQATRQGRRSTESAVKVFMANRKKIKNKNIGPIESIC